MRFSEHCPVATEAVQETVPSLTVTLPVPAAFRPTAGLGSIGGSTALSTLTQSGPSLALYNSLLLLSAPEAREAADLIAYLHRSREELDRMKKLVAQAMEETMTDTLPEGLTYVSAAGTDWSCGESSGVITCDLTYTLYPGDTDGRFTSGNVNFPLDVDANFVVRATGTIKPLSVCVAMPISTASWRNTTPCSSSKRALI